MALIHQGRNKKRSVLTLYMDKLHRFCFEVILCDLRLINTSGQTKELF